MASTELNDSSNGKLTSGNAKTVDVGRRKDDEIEKEVVSICTDDSASCNSTGSGDEKKNGSPSNAKEDFRAEVGQSEGYEDANGESIAGVDKGVNSNSVGRRGDPRMHRAVAARRANPSMSLLEALVVGGFKFPNGTDGNGKSDRNIYDADNVLLCQRKNQLSRRLRLARRRSRETKTNVESLKRMNDHKQGSDFYAPTASVASNLQRNPAVKRSLDGQNLDEHLAVSRLKASNDASLDAKSLPYPQSSLTALLQQQQQQRAALGQTQAYFGVPPLFSMHQQGLDNPFLHTQVPLSFGLNGDPTQNTTQSNLDQYLKMAAGSIGLGHQSILFPQPNIQAAHNPLIANSALQQMYANADNKLKTETSQVQDEKEKVDDITQTERINKLQRAVGIFELEKGALMQRCLILAGFGESERNNQDLTHAFEGMLNKRH